MSLTDMIPKWLLWSFAIPFMIALLPIGVLYCGLGIYYEICNNRKFHTYKHDIFYSMIRPGFYVGLFVSILVMYSIGLLVVLFKKIWGIRGKTEVEYEPENK
ncbi:hypothetical protein ACFVS2_25855 [Brevibacillus sp. NPDC058079]|uniref:hypothetical protein n=1 Tax=Brevibacillus sp. NPDC058079 TaxID=3346330 RepID=UPI0036E3C9E2